MVNSFLNFSQAGGTAESAPVVVVGAGLAGLVVTYRLWQAGVPVCCLEASDRTGGRIYSIPNALGTSITAELGGEAFDSDHVACLNLAQTFGLPIADVGAVMASDAEETFFFDGARLDSAAIMAEFATVMQAHQADWEAVQAFLDTATVTPAIATLDALSIPDYLAKIGASPQLQRVIAAAYTIKYGMAAADQSCLNLLCFFRQPEDCTVLWGTSDERYYLRGGNQQLPDALAAAVGECVQIQSVVEAIAPNPAGGYHLRVRQGDDLTDGICDRLVLTLPFTALRQVDLTVPLPEAKRRAIAELSYNSPTKLITAHKHKPWQANHRNGLAYTDLPLQHCWEASDSLFSDTAGLLVSYPGGAAGRALSEADLPTATDAVIHQLDQIFPGVAAATDRHDALRSPWLQDPRLRGAYSCYRVGQWSQIYGCEGDRVGNLFFAGEHCSRRYQGYMEGACETAEQVALALLEELGQAEAAATQRSRLATYAQQRSIGFHPA